MALTRKDYSVRLKQARKRVAHHAAGVALAERRIRYFRNKRYVAAAKGGHTAEKEKARRAIIRWKTRKLRAEDYLRNWKVIYKRRKHQKFRYEKNHPKIAAEAYWEGVPVAPWMVGKAPGRDGKYVNWLQLAREHGWTGTVVSGIRTTAHSIELCEQMCGAPACPGRCAGASSNHNCDGPCSYPGGAIDVTDYYRFKAIMQFLGAPLQNDLPIDPVHFSVSGH